MEKQCILKYFQCPISSKQEFSSSLCKDQSGSKNKNKIPSIPPSPLPSKQNKFSFSPSFIHSTNTVQPMY